MDPSKVQGKIREQMKREIKARIDSEKKWNFIAKSENNKFYSQSYLNSKVNEKFEENQKKSSDQPPPQPQPKGEGAAFFTSPVMHEAMKNCRCGRKSEGTHLLKCLQRSLIKYSDGQISTGSSPTGEKINTPPNIPRTSSEIFGFFQSKYQHLEKSTSYITPKVHLKHKITDNIYNNIIIG